MSYITVRVFVMSVAVCACAAAQTITGTLEGHVVDPAGAAVAAATVHATEKSTGGARTATTNVEGFYAFPYMPLGNYEVRVEAPGFQTAPRSAVVALNRATVLDFELKLAGVQESVTVSDAAPVIDTESGQVRRSLEDQMITAVPIGGRNFLNLAALLPGFQTNPTSGQNNFTLSSGSSVSFNGTGTRSATFQTDGVANDDSSENQNRQGVNLSTIKEFQILTNSFSAEFGRGSGAVVLVQTKGGTNSYHGEAYWLTTNSALNARGFFANAAGSHRDPATGRLVPNVPKTSSKTHRVGGTAGGAIIKDKLFYFGSYERFWSPGAASATVSLLPKEFQTPQVDPQLPDAAERKAWIQSVIDRFPKGVTPNNTVNNLNGYTASVANTNQNQDLSGRIDYRMGERDMLYTRYQYGDVLIQRDEIVRGINTKNDHRLQNYGLTWTHVYSPRWAGEFRFGFGRRRMMVGLVDGDNVPIVSWNIAFAPSSLGSAGQFPLKRAQNDFQYVYNVTAQVGSRHMVRFGTDTRRTELNDQIEQRHRGSWSFGSAAPYNALENFVHGIVQSYSQGFGPKINGFRAIETNLYVQDTFRASRTLTLDLGARFERVSKPTEVNALVDIPYGADAYLEPRFGFAWSPDWKTGLLGKLSGGGKAVLRGGFGLFHGRIFQSLFEQVDAAMRFNPPNGALVSLSNPDMSVARPLGDFRFTPGPPTSQVLLATADPGMRMPYTEQWNLTLERALPHNTVLSVSYVGNRGIAFLQYDWKNRAQFPIVSTVPSNYPGTGNFTGVLFDKIDPNLFNTNPAPGFISLSQQRTIARRQDGRYSVEIRGGNGAWSYYHALQTSFSKRLSGGLAFQAGYSWSKNIDTGSEATFVGGGDINALISERQGARSMRGLSRLDQPHRFVLSYTYDLPFFRGERGLFGRVLGGWQWAGISTFAAGNPITVLLGYDLNGDAIGGDRPWLLDPAVHGGSFDNARTNPATGQQFSQDRIPVSAFLPDQATALSRNWPWFPGTGYVASAGRNIFRIAGQNNFDTAFVKNTKLFGRDRGHELQFRAEVFNLFNRVQFDMPSSLSVVDTGVVGWRINPLFGRITGQRNGARSMQMTLRYQF